jgi:plasmid stabilization system protein ParE
MGDSSQPSLGYSGWYVKYKYPGERGTEYALSQRAQSGLDEIWDYSAQRWGTNQANRYIKALRDNMECLAADPFRGPMQDRALT